MENHAKQVLLLCVMGLLGYLVLTSLSLDKQIANSSTSLTQMKEDTEKVKTSFQSLQAIEDDLKEIGKGLEELRTSLHELAQQRQKERTKENQHRPNYFPQYAPQGGPHTP